MSEEKLYAVKNGEGKYWDFEDRDDFWELTYASCPTTDNELDAKDVINDYGGHIVTLIEEPKKVVLSEKQAEIVDYAHGFYLPANFISRNLGEDEELLINAYVNGYTVEKDDKRYLVELDGLVTTDGAKQYLTKKDVKWFASRRMSGLHQDFTDEELNEAPEWAQQLDREEVTDDEQ